METLDKSLVKTMLYLERYHPDSLDLIQDNLLVAQKNIIGYIGDETNQRKINKYIKDEMNVAFDGLDDEVIKDVENINGASWDSMGSVMAQGFVTSTLADAFVNYKDTSDIIKKRLTNKNTLIQGHTLDNHFKHLETTSVRKLQGLIANGFEQGQGIQEINRNIRNTIGNVNRNQVSTLVRTTLLEASENAKNESLDFFEDEILAWRYSSIMDTRTSKVCFVNNGIKHKNKKDFKVLPKNHYQCRSMLVPETEFSREMDALETDRNIVQWDGKKVNHRDGTKSTKFSVGEIKSVPKNANAETYFKTFDSKYQIDYMGRKRYDLWKSGKMSFDDAFNVSRKKTLPLDTIKAKVITPKVPEIKFGYDGKFDGYVKDIRPEAKIVIDRLPKPKSIKDVKKSGTYYARENLLESELDKNTFRHEYGHHIDHVIGEKLSELKLLRPSSTLYRPSFMEAFTADRKALKLNGRKGTFEMIDKIKSEWYEDAIKFKGTPFETPYLKPIENKYGAISDIFDAMTKGSLHNNGLVGHGSKYYKDSEKLGMESMANMFDMWSSGKDWDLAKKYIPNLANEFELLMKEVIDGKFD